MLVFRSLFHRSFEIRLSQLHGNGSHDDKDELEVLTVDDSDQGNDSLHFLKNYILQRNTKIV